MTPEIRYTTTSDGVSIAWGEAREGPALLSFGPTPFTHVQEHFALWEPYFGTLARSFRLITFDARGTGMSQRNVDAVSAETMMLSIHRNDEALLEFTGSPRLAQLYLAEFMRLYENHRARAKFRNAPRFLRLQKDNRWCKKYFQPNSAEAKARVSMAAPL